MPEDNSTCSPYMAQILSEQSKYANGVVPNEERVAELVARLLAHLDPDPLRSGLAETPFRVSNAFLREWVFGYRQNPVAVLKSFEDGAEGYDEMLWAVDIPFFSMCEHHMAPFFGTATAAYIPKDCVVGLSKFARLVDVFARRLQIQERLTVQIADLLNKELSPLGVGVFIKARHLCIESRGIRAHGMETKSMALRGVIKNDPNARYEFLSQLPGS